MLQVEKANEDLVVDTLTNKLNNMFTEDELEKNLDFVAKMGLSNEQPLTLLMENSEIQAISDDPKIVASAIEKAKNLNLTNYGYNFKVNLPLKRNKVYIMNLSSDKVKEFEEFMNNCPKNMEIKEAEYIQKENNYRQVFDNDNNAAKFLELVRSSESLPYEAKIHSETVAETLREKYKHKIRNVELKSQESSMNMGFPDFNNQFNYLNNPYQMNLMNMMMPNMNLQNSQNQIEEDMMNNFSQYNMMANGIPDVNSQLINNFMKQLEQNINMAQGGGNNYKQNCELGYYKRHNYHNKGKQNLFVRKAKVDGSETNTYNQKKYQNYNNRRSYPNNKDNQNTKTYGFPAQNNNYSKKSTNNYSRENSKNFESQVSIPLDSQNFPTLGGSIDVNVPKFSLLESNIMEDDSNYPLNSFKATKDNRAVICTKFNELKNTANMKINGNLEKLDENNIPIMQKEGDVKLECLDRTIAVDGCYSPTNPSKNVSRKQSMNSPLRKTPYSGTQSKNRSRIQSENY